MNDSVQVNQVYLIFNRPQFLVDSSVSINIIRATKTFSVISDANIRYNSEIKLKIAG